MTELLPTLGGLGLLLILSGFFSGSETALCALTRAQVERLRADTRKSSRSIVAFVDDPRRLFITILLGNTFVNIAFATLTAALIYGVSGDGPTGVAIVVATFSITLALLVFGEITPKTYAIRNAESFAGFTAPILWVFSIVIFPLRRMLRAITDSLLPFFGGVPVAPAERITREHLESLLDAQGLSGPGSEERTIIRRVLDLREIRATEIMVPRTEIVAMRTSATIGEVLRCAADSGFSSIPVFRDRIDNVSGVVRVKDWFRWRAHQVRDLTVEEFLVARAGFPVSDALLVHPPFFTPETRRVADLFADLMRHGRRVAFLVDEFGGVSGSVTIEDIVEEVMGEIVDEHDDPDLVHELAERAGEPSAFDVAGRVSVEIVNRRLGLRLDEELAQTIGGYVIATLNRIPVVGDAFTDEDGVGFEVTEAERHRVVSVVLRLPIEHR